MLLLLDPLLLLLLLLELELALQLLVWRPCVASGSPHQGRACLLRGAVLHTYTAANQRSPVGTAHRIDSLTRTHPVLQGGTVVSSKRACREFLSTAQRHMRGGSSCAPSWVLEGTGRERTFGGGPTT